MSEQSQQDRESSPVIGWGAVVLPHKRIRKNILIRECDIAASKPLDAQFRMMMAMPASRREGTVRRGVLTSVLAEYVLLDADDRIQAAAAYLVMKDIGCPYFWVYAEKKEGGTATSVHPLEANSPEEAEAALLRDPTIRMMETVGEFADMIDVLRKKK